MSSATFLFADQVERNRRSHGDFEEQEARAEQEGMVFHKLGITPPAYEDDEGETQMRVAPAVDSKIHHTGAMK